MAAEAAALLAALREHVDDVTAHARALLRRVRGGQLRTEQGVSALELRPQLLLLYLQDLALVAAAKVGGASLGAEPALPRLLETRVVLEKLRPLEQRLRYQVQKLLRAAAGGGGDSDPLRFRPAPGNLLTQQPDEEQEDPEEGGASGPRAPGLGGGRRYVPPRLVPVPYAAPEAPRDSRRLRAPGPALLLRELRAELDEGPEEQPAAAAGAPPGPAQTRRTRYEEAMLVRLSEGRRERGRRRRLEAAEASGFAGLVPWAGAGSLLEPEQAEEPPQKRRKRPKAPKRKGKGRGFRRRR